MSNTEIDDMQWTRIFTLLDAGTRWYREARAWFSPDTMIETYVFSNGPQDELRVEITPWQFDRAPRWVIDAFTAYRRRPQFRLGPTRKTETRIV